tara:strand:+ start:2359 stop:2820 length:462 start_codon:yes stop_codon:yes gene_type:complete
MAIEIEKKFLIVDDSFKKLSHNSIKITQGYIFSSKDKVLRVRLTPDTSKIAIKSGNDIIRKEYEYIIPHEDAKEILFLCKNYLIHKTRYFVDFKGFTWEIDVFENDNKGLIVAEIELKSKDQDFEKPNWIGDEVSYDKRYYNHYLSKKPFKLW